MTNYAVVRITGEYTKVRRFEAANWMDAIDKVKEVVKKRYRDSVGHCFYMTEDPPSVVYFKFYSV